MSKCDLCELKTIDKEYYKCEDFIIIDCCNCHVPMVVPFEHVDPKSNRHKRLEERMENELFRVGFDFYGDLNFFIDKQERKILDHMHWHARKKNE